LAARVASEAGDDAAARVERAWWLALSRSPTKAEQDAALAHLASQQQNAKLAGADGQATSDDESRGRAFESLCHVLLNLNEFIYVD
jgi:hypothetical protein